MMDTNTTYNATLVADELGMAYQDYNFMMALTGLMCGVLIVQSFYNLVVK